MPLRFVWGVVAEDNGNFLDPTDIGSLVIDHQFDASAAETQK